MVQFHKIVEMCGRYSQGVDVSKLMDRFNVVVRNDLLTLPKRYNIAPSQNAPVIIRQNQEDYLELFRWGLIPSWAKDPSIGNRMINARAEGIGKKPSFRKPLKRTRCLVPADSFYEWKLDENGRTKTPMRVVLKSHEPFAFAGLWDIWKDPKGKEIRSFTIITTNANKLLRSIHDRMPVILKKDDEEAWLDHNEEVSKLILMLNPLPDEKMEAYPVSKVVNSPRNDNEECIKPLKS